MLRVTEADAAEGAAVLLSPAALLARDSRAPLLTLPVAPAAVRLASAALKAGVDTSRRVVATTAKGAMSGQVQVKVAGAAPDTTVVHRLGS